MASLRRRRLLLLLAAMVTLAPVPAAARKHGSPRAGRYQKPLANAPSRSSDHPDPLMELGAVCVPGSELLSSGQRCVCGERGTVGACEPRTSRRLSPLTFSAADIDQVGVKILGGSTTSINKHMYMLALEMWGGILCGACIISNVWVLTAAHCLDGLDTRAGLALRAASTFRERGGQTFRIARVVSHERFDPDTFANDIGLLKVEPPFSAARGELVPALLPETAQSDPRPGTGVTLLGWGRVLENGTLSDELREAWVPVVKPDKCRRVYGTVITDSVICAGFHDGRRDACQADSGGPVMVNRTVVALVSFGEGCGRKNRPGVYTRLSSHRSWIRRHTGL